VNKAIEQAVERAITAMHDNLGEQVTVDDMARAAMFSKFHFTRVFERTTGVSPGRFLSAVRLQRAKQLLVSTDMTVADISFEVGYNSVGTFSSRFTRSVGLSPTAYRRLSGFTTSISVHEDGEEPEEGAEPPTATVEGTISTPSGDRRGLVFVGLFPNRVPEGRPVRCTVLHRPGGYRFENVPQGTWYLLAQSVAADTEALTRETFAGNEALSVGAQGPIVVDGESTTAIADLDLQPLRIVDPPVLLALLDARTIALRLTGGLEPEEPDESDEPELADEEPAAAVHTRVPASAARVLRSAA
jgi:AraC-like DNA-binding protein